MGTAIVTKHVMSYCEGEQCDAVTVFAIHFTVKAIQPAVNY